MDDAAKLRTARTAFEAGDYRRVRALCCELRAASDPPIASQAGALFAKVSADPVQVVILIGCLAFLARIVYAYVLS